MLDEKNKKYDLTALSLSDNFNLGSLVESLGGTNIKEGSPTRVKLAYPIDDNENAFMLTAVFSMDSENVSKLGSELRSKAEILRHLVLVAPEEKNKQGRSFKKEGSEGLSDKDNREKSSKPTRKVSVGEGSGARRGKTVTNKDLEKTIEELK